MSHVDEGLIHAWLEDQLPPEEAARVEQLVATDPAWGNAAAEARGLIAATSRVLGALDSAPSSARANWTGLTARSKRTKGAGVPLARRNWLRVAAVVALVAGVSGVWFSGDNVPVTVGLSDGVTEELAAKKRGVGGPPPVAETQPLPVQQTAPGVPAEKPLISANARSVGARLQEQGVVGEVQSRPRASAVPAVPPATSPPPDAVRDEAAGVRAASNAAKDTSVDGRVAGNATGVGAGGSRGAGGVVTSLAERTFQSANAAPRTDVSDAMKALGRISADSLQRGCWLPQDTQAQLRQTNESARPSVMVLRFLPPVVTDVPAAPAPAIARASSPPPTTPVAALRAAPAAARIQNTTARAKDDSTFVAEWFSPDNRTTQLTFRIRGDTLRGTTIAITGDVVIPGSVLVAVRAQCPQ